MIRLSVHQNDCNAHKILARWQALCTRGCSVAKVVWVVLVVLVLAAGGAAWWLYQSLDRVVASAIRTYAPPMVGVSVQLEGVKIQPAEGLASLNGLVLGNPKGFETPRAFAVQQIRMQLDVATLTQDLIAVREIRIDQPELTYEHASGGSNLEVIQRQVEAYIAAASSSASHAKDPADGQGPGKKLTIDHFIVQGAKAHVSANVLKGRAVSVPLADIHLVDMGKNTNGITPAEAARQVVNAITQNATKAVAPLQLGGTVVEGVKKGAASAADAVKSFFK